MKPHKLTLSGFKGIASGRSKETLTIDLQSLIPADAQLVAFAGPNGSGKTTIMDNLHPYRVMPSHASTPSPNAFSYYDHLVAGEGTKELLWEHSGTKYLSSIRLRATAKTKKQEAYLFVVNDDGSTAAWNSPTTGLASDGKADTYDQCIEAILGKPEVFFSAQFSAQGKKPIAEMQTGDVKKLLAQMLNLDEVADLSAKAGDVFKRLKPFMAVEQEMSMRIRQGLRSESILSSELNVAMQASEQAEQELKKVAAEIARLTLAKASLTNDMARQAAIKSQHEAIDAQISSAQAEATTQMDGIVIRHQAEDKDLRESLQEAKRSQEVGASLMQQLRQRQTEFDRYLSMASGIESAEKRLVDLNTSKRQKLSFVEDKALEVIKIDEIRLSLNKLSEEMTRLASDGEHMAIALAAAQATASLLNEVPCKGMEMAGNCKLLAQANEAAFTIEGQQTKVVNARALYKQHMGNKSVGASVLQGLLDVERRVKETKSELTAIDEEIATCRETLAQRKAVDSAKELSPKLRSDLAEASEGMLQAKSRTEAVELQVSSLNARHEREIQSMTALNDQAIKRLQEVKSKLAPLISHESQDEIHRQMNVEQERYEQATAHVSDVEKKLQAIRVEIDVTAQRNAEADAHDRKAHALATEMSKWTLLSKSLGNDGVIAMSIDDAGPAISGISNSLLEDCYGGRFVIAIETQEKTASGLQKEAFNVMVEDTRRGEVKLLDRMSGGEKVWINECLVRAFNLYMTEASDTLCDTLFSDESDGPLDPERKRQYMEMKRKVLCRGGYSREYLITQTPELMNMCDAVIDVTTL